MSDKKGHTAGPNVRQKSEQHNIQFGERKEAKQKKPPKTKEAGFISQGHNSFQLFFIYKNITDINYFSFKILMRSPVIC